jgi:hypothetical protein
MRFYIEILFRQKRYSPKRRTNFFFNNLLDLKAVLLV